MRVLCDGDGERVHVWLPAGRGTLHGPNVTWHTAHAPFTLYAGTEDDEVCLPGVIESGVLEGALEAAPLDARRAAVVRRGDGLVLSIVDVLDGHIERTEALRVPSLAIDAFASSRGAEDLLADRPEQFAAERPRGVRVIASGARLGIASAETGDVASFSVERGEFECAFRVPTTEGDRLWAAPIADGMLVAARFDGRWSEVRVLGRDGAVLGRWPEESDEDGSEKWGMVAPVVLGGYAVVCTDAPKAHVLELPSLREVGAIELPGVARDAHGAGDRWACVTAQHVVLARLAQHGALELEQVLRPLELIERAGARRSFDRELPGVDQRSHATRLDALFPSEPMVLVTSDRMITHENGSAFVPPPPEDPFFGPLTGSSYVLLDAHGRRGVVTSHSGTSSLDLETGALTALTMTMSSRARVLSNGVWLVHEQVPTQENPEGDAEDGSFGGNPFAQERVVQYVTKPGVGRRLRVAPVDHRRWFETSSANRVVWSEPAEDVARTRLYRFVEDSQALDILEVDAALKNLSLDGETLFAAAGDFTGRIVRIDDAGVVTPQSDDVFEWLDVLTDFVVAAGTAYWTTPYAVDRPQQLLALDLLRATEPRVVFEATFGALTSLRIANGRLWWLESQTSHAEHNGVSVLEPRAVIASRALGG